MKFLLFVQSSNSTRSTQCASFHSVRLLDHRFRYTTNSVGFSFDPFNRFLNEKYGNRQWCTQCRRQWRFNGFFPPFSGPLFGSFNPNQNRLCFWIRIVFVCECLMYSFMFWIRHGDAKGFEKKNTLHSCHSIRFNHFFSLHRRKMRRITVNEVGFTEHSIWKQVQLSPQCARLFIAFRSPFVCHIQSILKAKGRIEKEVSRRHKMEKRPPIEMEMKKKNAIAVHACVCICTNSHTNTMRYETKKFQRKQTKNTKKIIMEKATVLVSEYTSFGGIIL